MKKFLAFALVFALVASFAACGGSGVADDTTAPDITEEPIAGPVAGGYTVNSELAACELPEDVQAAFDLAVEGYAGTTLTPVAYLGSQVVAGANYAILCKSEPVVPNAEASLAVAVIYKDLEGGAEVLRVNDFDILNYVSGNDNTEVPEEAVDGGWTVNTEFPEAVISDNAKAACDACFEGLMGTHYEPIACLATQVVAGTNFAMLCKVTTPAAENAQNNIAVVTLYAGVDGTNEVLNVTTLNIADLAAAQE